MSEQRAPVVAAVARGGSDAAVRFAAEEARRTRRCLDLVHVGPADGGWQRQLGMDSLRLASEHAGRLVGSSTSVRTEILVGSLLPVLAEAADGAALMVLERRPTPAVRHVSSSTTAALAACSDAPVASVPAGWVGGSTGCLAVGLNPAGPDEQAVRTAVVLARLRRAALRVVVACGPHDGSGDPSGHERLRAEIRALLEHVGADACDVVVEMEPLGPDVALLAAATGVDLLVLGRHHPPSSSGSRLGVVARTVLRDAACPVLLTRPAHPALAPGHDEHATVA